MKLQPLDLGQTGGDLALNAALVVAAEDLEEAVVTPVGVPGVGQEPVGGAVLDAPAKHTDGVATQRLSGHVLVHTWGAESKSGFRTGVLGERKNE